MYYIFVYVIIYLYFIIYYLFVYIIAPSISSQRGYNNCISVFIVMYVSILIIFVIILFLFSNGIYFMIYKYYV